MTIRTTISLPDDLKRRMDKLKVPVNWSQVAALAFEEKLSQLSTHEATKTMKQTIERLRQSKLKTNDASYTKGIQSGRKWATRVAEWDELERLADQWGGFADGTELLDTRDDNPRVRLFESLNPRYEGDLQSCDEFWEQFVDVRRPSSDLVRGFCSGAIEIYNEVKDKV